MDHLPPEEARPNLADLVRINRLLGGHKVIRGMLKQIYSPKDRFTVLDVGAASGDTGRLVQSLYPLATVVNLDRHTTNLELASSPKLLADAFRLPLRDASFDIVLCSLFLHHFTDEQVIALLRSFYAVARRAVLVSDLERSIIPLWFLPATRKLFGWNRVSVSDGVISVRAALRVDELEKLARAAGLRNAYVRAHRPAFRVSLVARK